MTSTVVLSKGDLEDLTIERISSRWKSERLPVVAAMAHNTRPSPNNDLRAFFKPGKGINIDKYDDAYFEAAIRECEMEGERQAPRRSEKSAERMSVSHKPSKPNKR